MFIIDFTGAPNDADLTVWLEFEDQAGDPLDWSGYSLFRMDVGNDRGAGAPLLSLTQAAGDVVPSSPSATARLTFRFRPEIMVALPAGRYPHDIKCTAGGREQIFARGALTIVDGVIA